MQKFQLNSSDYDMAGEGREKKEVRYNKRCCYLFAILFIAVPVITGVLVWYFLPKCPDNGSQSNADRVTGGTVRTTRASTVPVTTISTRPTSGPIPGQPWTYLRLPRYIMPLHYDLTLYPDFYEDHGWFYGNETIEIRISEETKYILIHFNLMNITRTDLYHHYTNESIPIKRTFSYPKHQFWVVETEMPIEANTMVDLQLQFDGSLTTSIVGFYKSSYVNSLTNETRHLATSKFEPVDARKAFPCFDEPNIKANYTVTLIHREGYTALSNMPEETITLGEDNMLVTRFQRSVPMSTYLVCFIVCDFLQLNKTTNEGNLVRVWATPDKINQAEYALDLANNTMSLYEQKFDLPYPLPKQDMIAIPDFVSGAMEHWGLITYRETNMLLDENEASSANKQRVAAVIAHELAHQWFGNIVTMDWWNDLWLNEGFASFMEYIGVADFETTWQMMSQFIVEDIQPVMVNDAGVNSHPIVVTVDNPDEINQVFDSISYSKGAAVIGMLKGFMGDEAFFEGIQLYLKRYQWGNAKTDDLWYALSNVSGAPDVKGIMDTWTLQMGLPVVHITIMDTDNGSTIKASQTRFLQDPYADPSASQYTSPFNYTWFIPLDYIRDNQDEAVSLWMNRTDASFTVADKLSSNTTAWIKFNSEQTGFYRVNYPDVLWRRFADDILPINHSVLSPADRSGLLSDAFNLARAGLLSYSITLDMTTYLDKEDSHLAWDTAYMGMLYITEMLQSTGQFGLWRDYVLSKSRPVLEKLTWEDTGSHLQKLLRSNIISLSCELGDKDCRSNATWRFRAWVSTGESIPPNLRSAVYKYGIADSSNSDDWDYMWNRYIIETVPQERIKLLRGMAKTRETWLIYRFLDYAMDESKVRSQDFFSVISYLTSNSVANPIVWQWYQENWLKIVDRFSLRSRSFGRSVGYIISQFNTQFQLESVKAFFSKYPDAGAGARVRLQSLDSINSNIKWMERNMPVIVDWLKQRTS